jgi:hypothetical protein
VSDDILEELYSADPDEFVAERKRLERALRDEGRTDEADELSEIKKPSAPVFAANRLAREQRGDIDKLIAAADRLASAHERADADTLREAQRDLADLVSALVRGAGLSDSMEQRLGTLLRSAASSQETAERLRRGVLSEELEPVAFDALAGVKLAPAKRRPPAEPKPTPTSERRRQRAEELEAQLSEAKDAMRAAERERKEAERAVDRAARRVEQLERRLADVRDAV